MGYTHFSKPCGTTGVYAGAKGSEVLVASGNGLIQAVSMVVSMTIATTAADTGYCVAPIAGTVTAYATFGVSAGTGRQATVTVGSAGAILMDTGVTGVTGTIGTAVAMTNSSGTTSVSAGQAMLISFASCATAQYPASVTVIVTRSA